MLLRLAGSKFESLLREFLLREFESLAAGQQSSFK